MDRHESIKRALDFLIFFFRKRWIWKPWIHTQRPVGNEWGQYFYTSWWVCRFSFGLGILLFEIIKWASVSVGTFTSSAPATGLRRLWWRDETKKKVKLGKKRWTQKSSSSSSNVFIIPAWNRKKNREKTRRGRIRNVWRDVLTIKEKKWGCASCLRGGHRLLIFWPDVIRASGFSSATLSGYLRRRRQKHVNILSMCSNRTAAIVRPPSIDTRIIILEM